MGPDATPGRAPSEPTGIRSGVMSVSPNEPGRQVPHRSLHPRPAGPSPPADHDEPSRGARPDPRPTPRPAGGLGRGRPPLDRPRAAGPIPGREGDASGPGAARDVIVAAW